MSDYTPVLPLQHPAHEAGYTSTLLLIPPLASEETALSFAEPPYGLCVGGDDATEAARRWALERRYLQAYGLADCAHGLYLMRKCPGRCTEAGLDHTTLWVPFTPGERPFLLTHPHALMIPDETLAYAAYHGLTISTDLDDEWYSASTLPIRMTIPSGVTMLWPVEERAAILLRSWPVQWPGDENLAS